MPKLVFFVCVRFLVVFLLVHLVGWIFQSLRLLGGLSLSLLATFWCLTLIWGTLYGERKRVGRLGISVSSISFVHFPLCSPFAIPITCALHLLWQSHRFWISGSVFILFSLCFLVWEVFIEIVSCSEILYSALSGLLMRSSKTFWISVTEFLVSSIFFVLS